MPAIEQLVFLLSQQDSAVGLAFCPVRMVCLKQCQRQLFCTCYLHSISSGNGRLFSSGASLLCEAQPGVQKHASTLVLSTSHDWLVTWAWGNQKKRALKS